MEKQEGSPDMFEYSPSSPKTPPKSNKAVTSTSREDPSKEDSKEAIRQTRDYLERVQEVAQTALRQEAALRAQLRDQLKARDAKKSKTMKPGKARAVKRTEAQEYITGSGKRQKVLPVPDSKSQKLLADLRRVKKEPASATKPKQEPPTLNATFSLAERDAATIREGLKGGDVSRLFDKKPFMSGKVTLPEHFLDQMVKPDGEMQEPGAQAIAASAGKRPLPKFAADPGLEPMDTTVPWEKTPANGRGGGRRQGAATTASHCHHLTQMVTMAPSLPMQHHHCHLPPAPAACHTSASCAPAAPPPLAAANTIFWCSTSSSVDCRAQTSAPEARSHLCGVAKAASSASAGPCKEELTTEGNTRLTTGPMTRSALQRLALQQSPEQSDDCLLTKYGDNDFGDEFDNFP